MGSVVVTGAAGTLGRRVVRLLAASDGVERVVAVDVAAAPDGDARIERVALDLAEPTGADDPLTLALDGADGLIHLAWHIPDRHRPGAAETNRLVLARVLAAAGQARPGAVVHLSSATVYGAWPDNPVPLTEEAPIRPNLEFGFAVGKAEAERTVAEWSDHHPDVPVAILRPTATVGAPERPLYQALGGTQTPRTSDDSTRPVQFLHIDDLAAAVVWAWRHRLSGVFNVAPDRGIDEDTARALSGGLAKVPLPDRLARAVATWRWHLWRTGVPREALAYAQHPWVVAADKLIAAGWEPRFTTEEALVATDARPHWDDLPPGRRQNYTLALVVVAAVVLLGAFGAAVLAWRGRRRRRRGG
ncbi:MAG: NAD-dependent epimerase/dehydratase family protein [Acidimicrobiales bacterium]